MYHESKSEFHSSHSPANLMRARAHQRKTLCHWDPRS